VPPSTLVKVHRRWCATGAVKARPTGGDRRSRTIDARSAAIEAGADALKIPWHRDRGALFCLTNIATGNAHQGINVLTL
jgi:hypothetical protein